MLCKLFPNHIQTIQLHHRNASSVHWISFERNEIPQRSTHKLIELNVMLPFGSSECASIWFTNTTIFIEMPAKWFTANIFLVVISYYMRTNTHFEWQMPFSLVDRKQQLKLCIFITQSYFFSMATTYIRCIVYNWRFIRIISHFNAYQSHKTSPIPISKSKQIPHTNLTSHCHVIESISFGWCMASHK